VAEAERNTWTRTVGARNVFGNSRTQVVPGMSSKRSKGGHPWRLRDGRAAIRSGKQGAHIVKTWCGRLVLGSLAAVGLVLAGCGGGDSETFAVDPALVGTWRVTSLRLDDGSEILDPTGGSVQLELRADGTYTTTEIMGDVKTTEDGTWAVAGDQYRKTTGGVTETLGYTLSGNTLQFQWAKFYSYNQGATMTLQR
jgi:hypothetical protein